MEHCRNVSARTGTCKAKESLSLGRGTEDGRPLRSPKPLGFVGRLDVHGEVEVETGSALPRPVPACVADCRCGKAATDIADAPALVLAGSLSFGLIQRNSLIWRVVPAGRIELPTKGL